ncbi:hypothetical protein Zmor_020548 [Zophobas morio]|uniref:Uncharacterized protein n=1 Tax=Zophobas morio TaxID=2755281 RepID=A0AA38MAH0_9CUCU|nr:hypothetical protein Zmor_020548 [Zophobas morio]
MWSVCLLGDRSGHVHRRGYQIHKFWLIKSLWYARTSTNHKVCLISHLGIETVCKCGFMFALIIHHCRIKAISERISAAAALRELGAHHPLLIMHLSNRRPHHTLFS